jgi:1,4-alpha-glucan branching enzyme
VRVELVIDAPRAGSVELMGDATEWTVTHLARLRDGRWRTELRLPPGVHRIAVRSDGGPWMAPPGLPTGNDDFGTPVGLIILRGR